MRGKEKEKGEREKEGMREGEKKGEGENTLTKKRKEKHWKTTNPRARA